jgi:RNA polymerase sigma-70 factor (ECF subfamily)
MQAALHASGAELMGRPGPRASGDSVEQTKDRSEPLCSRDRFRSMVDANFAFIWRSLRGLGVPRDSADDAAQHVFWIASQKVASIAVGSERAFLFQTALGVAANARRALARNREILDEGALIAHPDKTPTAEALVQTKEERALLDRALEGMADDLRTVFVLFVLEGATVPEIAELLDAAPGTVASRLRRAREAFHEIAKRIQARAAGRSAGGSR